MIHNYLLGLGSNQGQREAHLRRAVRFLRTLGEVTAISPVYWTEPEGMPGAGDFLNLAAALDSELEPEALLEALKAHESRCGRSLADVLRPRPIDIDILLDGERLHASARLTIPHPRLAQRRFALAPLADIAPQQRHPLEQKTISDLLAGLEGGGRVERLGRLEE